MDFGSYSFTYDKPVTGKNFIGKRDDATILTNLLRQNENVAIYGPPKSGKMSLIHQAVFNLRQESGNLLTAEVRMNNIRSAERFFCALGDAVVRAFATTPDEYRQIVDSFLGNTHYVFDRCRYSDYDEIISTNWNLDDKDKLAMLRFPYRIASVKGSKLLVILNEFQNIEFLEDADTIMKMMETVMKEARSDIEGPSCVIIFKGSRLNAMKSLFRRSRCFYRFVECFETTPVDRTEITQYINKVLMASGKVFDEGSGSGICELFRDNIWHINHFMFLCDHMSKGLVTQAILMEALGMMISIYEPSFKAIMYDLTTFQINLLKAVADGQTKFSSAGTIREYNLNSSANVKRLKEALMKKEIITFNDKDEPEIIDPLFEYWFKNYYLK